MVMKIKANEFIKKLEDAPEKLDKKIAVLLDNAPLTSTELHEFHLPQVDIVAKIKAQQIKSGFGLGGFSVLQKQTNFNLDGLKLASLSKHDATLLTMADCVDKKLCSAKEFIKETEKNIANKTFQKQNMLNMQKEKGM